MVGFAHNLGGCTAAEVVFARLFSEVGGFILL